VIDLHVHILPGLDDGLGSMSEAVRMCRIASEDGAMIIVATPHMRTGSYGVNRERIFDRLHSLERALAAEEVSLRLLPGADVHADGGLLDDVRAGGVMTVGDGGKYLMVELSEDVMPPQVEEMLFRLQLMEIRPILSHPERNLEVQENPSVLLRMVRAGNLVQITAASVTGEFGGRAEKCAVELLKAGLAHLVASDAHSPDHRPPGLSRARAVVERMIGEESARVIFEDRPEKIVAGVSVDVPAPVEPRLGRRRRWWRR